MSWRKVGSLGPQSRRCFASLPAKGKVESQVSRISAVDNGFLVGSIENYAPVSHVIVAVGAGPRHEKAHEKGCAHAIRTLSNLSTTDATQFAISRVLVSTKWLCRQQKRYEKSFSKILSFCLYCSCFIQ